MNKNEDSLSLSLADSLTDALNDTAEVALDSFMKDGVIKEIPLIKYVVTVYNVVDSVKGRHNLKKLKSFLDELNRNILNEDKLEEYKEKFSSNAKFRNQELEYIVILLDRYIEYEKSNMLAKLYWSYLSGRINWDEFSCYSVIIERFLPGDIETLFTEDTYVIQNNDVPATILRLIASGLMMEQENASGLFIRDNGNYSITPQSLNKFKSKERVYGKTEFGIKLVQILKK